MKVYCDTSTLFHNVRRSSGSDEKSQMELQALQKLLDLHRAGKILMMRSGVALRELGATKDLQDREALKRDYDALTPIPQDERSYGSNTLTDHLGGSITNPLVSDVQDEGLFREIESRFVAGRARLESKPLNRIRRDAQHITQAICNRCDVFLTRDERTIVRPHGQWLEGRFSGFKLRSPSKLLAELFYGQPPTGGVIRSE